MAIVVREYLGSPMGLNESAYTPFSFTENFATDYTISEDSIMVDIEGIHVGPTRNYTWYTEEALKGSVKTWTNPYQRPLILHHNEKDGKIIGRIFNAQYTDMNTRSKTGALVFTCNVSDEDGVKGVKDGRLKTVSIGVIAHDVRCSICGHEISKYGECEHERGAVYEGKTCYWMIYEMEAKELSYVIVPSDIYAHNIKIYSPNSNNLKGNLQEGVLQMTKAKEIKENIESQVIVEDAEKKVEAIVEDADKKVEAEAKEEPKKEEPAKEEETVDTLKKTIITLQDVIAGLQKKVEKAEAEKEAAETELVNANAQLKEFAVEQVLMLREQLGRPTLLKENLIKRSQESLMDSICDLKEELGMPATKAVNLTESTETVEEIVTAKAVEVTESVETAEETEVNNMDELSKVEMVAQESLVDKEKDSSVKKEEKSEKNSELDVKENAELSNIDYETTLEATSKFYNL